MVAEGAEQGRGGERGEGEKLNELESERGRQAGEYAELEERSEPMQHKCQTPTAPGVAGFDLRVNHWQQKGDCLDWTQNTAV
ncbi:unnamed protein product [Pleuronectes platessa]|uniref:Uncharacterized protein n=1 Tax=Pleuronectes platessa TaxID=8262 RepID=A0A9N7UTC2_PLEPL|nr:unnamed protein product [Pleuronectes platessa]